MRTILDADGRRWDVEMGRESYGIQVYLFIPQDGGGVRKAMMVADTRLEGERELREAEESALLERLADSQPWGETTLR